MQTVKEYESAIRRFLEDSGATDLRSEHGGKHMKMRFTYNGRDMMHVFPVSASDWRGLSNTISDLRHELKLVGAGKAPPSLTDRLRAAATEAERWRIWREEWATETVA